ncbi:hypothetical protein [Neobacillus niacini]|nr:hypothetical protein [Neobacillus niacini]
MIFPNESKVLDEGGGKIMFYRKTKEINSSLESITSLEEVMIGGLN